MIHYCFAWLHIYLTTDSIKSCSVYIAIFFHMIMFIHIAICLFIVFACSRKNLTWNLYCFFNKRHATFWAFSWFVLLHFRVHYTSVNCFSLCGLWFRLRCYGPGGRWLLWLFFLNRLRHFRFRSFVFFGSRL